MTFESGQRCTQAVVDATTKENVLFVISRDIESVRIWISLWIPVACGEKQAEHVALANRGAVNFGILFHETKAALDGTFVSQHLVDGIWNQRQIIF